MKTPSGGLACDHCGDEIPQVEFQRTWVGPVVAKGVEPRHYHLAREYPECRRAGGIDVDPPSANLINRLISGLEASG